MRPSMTIELNEHDRLELERWVRQGATPQKQAVRARMIVLRACENAYCAPRSRNCDARRTLGTAALLLSTSGRSLRNFSQALSRPFPRRFPRRPRRPPAGAVRPAGGGWQKADN